MSLGVPTSLPRICSGLAYAGVAMRSMTDVPSSSSSGAPATIPAIPKSSSFGVPSGVTRILPGLMSRCTMRLRCA